MASPIQSHVGHGSLGLRSRLRDFEQFAEAQEGTPQLWAEVALGVPIQTNWEANSGVYRTSFYRAFDGIQLDVVQVLTVNRHLRRVESIAACAATSGTYFYDSAGLANLWDSGLAWDGGELWDVGSWLYVNAPAAELNDGQVVISRVGFYFGSDGVTQPQLGSNLLTNGSFESDLDGWTQTTSGTGTLGLVADPVRDGAKACSIAMVGGSPGLAAIHQELDTIAGGIYCLSFSYFYDYNGSQASYGGLAVLISDAGGSDNVVQEDGRSYVTGGTYPIVPPPQGEWRRASFYFAARTSSTRVKLSSQTGLVAGGAYVDNVRLQRVHRWVRYEPRLARGAAPTIDEGRQDIYFGQWSIGQASVSLANDGLLETLLGQFEPVGGEVILRQGGRFSEAEELTLEACRTVFVGRIQNCDLEQTQATLSLENTQGQFQAQVPLRTFDVSESPDADARIQGQPRPMLFGYQTGIPPRRISRTDGGLGVYEVADCDDCPDGIGVSDASTARYGEVRLFQDDDAAQRGDLALSTEVTDHVVFDPITGRFTALNCLKPVLVDEEHQFYSFSINGGGVLDCRVLDANEETLQLLPTGVGANNNFTAVGAPTVYEAVQVLGDSARADSISTSGVRRLEVTCPAISGSAAILHVELRAWMKTKGGDREDGDRFRFYLDPGGTGTRYYSPYVDEPPGFYKEHVYRWLLNPSTGAAFTQTEVNALVYGVEYEPNGLDYLVADTMLPNIRRNKSAVPTASRPSIRSPKQFAALLQQAMLSLAALTSGIAVTFDETTFKFTIKGSKSVSSLTLYTKDGHQKSGWPALGYGTDDNKTGLLTYEADVAYYDPETEIDAPVLRAAAVGYVDDVDGTFTGVAGAPIELAPDVLRFILLRLLRVDPDRIDEATFVAARATAKSQAVYIDESATLAEVVERIEQGEQADLIIDGDRYYFSARPTAWEDGGVELHDADFIGGVHSRKVAEHVYALVRVAFARDPGRGTKQTYELAPAGDPRLRFGRSEARTFETYLLDPGDAAGVRDAMAALAAAPRRMYEIRARGQLLRVRLEQIVRLYPVTGGLSDEDGNVSPVDVRVFKRVTDPYTLESTALAVEV